MSNTVTLDDIHRRSGATFAATTHGGSRPAHYGDVLGEYWAARRQAVVIDRNHRGRLRLAGRDRLDLLHRLSTNDVHTLAAGRGVPDLFLTPKGRIIELFDLLVLEDHLLLALLSSNSAGVMGWITKFVFMEDVTATDVSSDTSELGVFGPAAAEVLAAAGVGADDLSGRDHRQGEITGRPVLAGGAEPLAGRGFRVICARSDAPEIWNALVRHGAALGLRPTGAEVEEILRVEAGLPAPGRELSERFNPLEAELRQAISFTKGCYTGQEVVARLNTYQKVQRGLRGLRVSGKVMPPPESRVLAADGAEVGRVTSAVSSPGLGGAPLALAYVELEQGSPGAHLRVEIGQEKTEAEAEVLPPPFVTPA